MIESIKCLEFIGLPGSGKTSVSNHIIERLKKSYGINVASRSDIDFWVSGISRWHKVCWLLKNPIKLFLNICSAINVSVKYGPLRLENIARALKLPIIDLFTQEYLHSHPDAICVIDQGSLQNIWSIVAHDRELKKCAIKKLSKHQICRNFSTLYIHVACTAELASKRISIRTHGNSRFEALEDQHRQYILDNASRPLDIIIQTIIQEKQPLFKVNAQDPIEDKSKLIIQHYESIRKPN